MILNFCSILVSIQVLRFQGCPNIFHLRESSFNWATSPKQNKIFPTNSVLKKGHKWLPCIPTYESGISTWITISLVNLSRIAFTEQCTPLHSVSTKEQEQTICLYAWNSWVLCPPISWYQTIQLLFTLVKCCYDLHMEYLHTPYPQKETCELKYSQCDTLKGSRNILSVKGKWVVLEIIILSKIC